MEKAITAILVNYDWFSWFCQEYWKTIELYDGKRFLKSSRDSELTEWVYRVSISTVFIRLRISSPLPNDGVKLQMGVLTSGEIFTNRTELIRRKAQEKFMLNSSLITKADFESKFEIWSGENYWLDANFHYKFYQFWLNATDF